MSIFEIVLRIIGIIADIVTISVVFFNLIALKKTKKYLSDNIYDCKVTYYACYEDIPNRFKTSEGGEEFLGCSVFLDVKDDSAGENYTVFCPKYAAVMRNVKIYIICLDLIGDNPIRKSQCYRFMQEYKEMKSPLCINCSPGDCFPGFLVEWKDYHGEHRYYSNTKEVVSRFNKDIVLSW